MRSVPRLTETQKQHENRQSIIQLQRADLDSIENAHNRPFPRVVGAIEAREIVRVCEIEPRELQVRCQRIQLVFALHSAVVSAAAAGAENARMGVLLLGRCLICLVS